MHKETLIVNATESGLRVDLFLKLKYPDSSRTHLQALIEQGHITCNHLPIKKREKLKAGDLLEIHFQDNQVNPQLIPQEIPLEILYEDEAFIVINKPRNLVTHPAPGHPSNTLVNALLYHCQTLENDNTLRPGIVHRLDKDTSGMMLIAKTRLVHDKLSNAFKERSIHKEYLALCLGNPCIHGMRRIETPLGRDPNNRKKISVVPAGKHAITDIELLRYHQGYSLIKIFPHTGRTHQIRVHLASIGHPILGDPLYGISSLNKKLNLSQQMLHAYSLRFKHPLNGADLYFNITMPADMKELEKRLL